MPAQGSGSSNGARQFEQNPLIITDHVNRSFGTPREGESETVGTDTGGTKVANQRLVNKRAKKSPTRGR